MPDNHTRARVRPRVRRAQRVLVVANLSRFAQGAELDLGGSSGDGAGRDVRAHAVSRRSPTRRTSCRSGRTSFYWFTLETPAERRADVRREPRARDAGAVDRACFTERARVAARARRCSSTPSQRRWFRGKARARKDGRITDVVPLDGPKGQRQLVLFEVEYVEGDPELYVVPLAFVERRRGAPRRARGAGRGGGAPERARQDAARSTEGLLVDGIAHDTPARLMESIKRRTTLVGEQGQLAPQPLRAFTRGRRRRSAGAARRASSSRPTRRCSSATRCCSRSFAQIEAGPNPELELGRFFTERGATNMPRMLAGARVPAGPSDKESATLATVQELVPNEGDAWQLGAGRRSIATSSACCRIATRRRRRRRSTAGTLLQQAARGRRPSAMLELLGGVHRPRAAARRGAPPSCTSLLASEPVDPAFTPAAVHRLLPAVAVPGRAQDVGAHRRDCCASAWPRSPEPHARDRARHLRRRGAHRRAPARHHRAQARRSSASACTATSTSARCSRPATTS